MSVAPAKFFPPADIMRSNLPLDKMKKAFKRILDPDGIIPNIKTFAHQVQLDETDLIGFFITFRVAVLDYIRYLAAAEEPKDRPSLGDLQPLFKAIAFLSAAESIHPSTSPFYDADRNWISSGKDFRGIASHALGALVFAGYLEKIVCSAVRHRRNTAEHRGDVEMEALWGATRPIIEILVQAMRSGISSSVSHVSDRFRARDAAKLIAKSGFSRWTLGCNFPSSFARWPSP